MANSRSGESVLQRAMRILDCFDADRPRLTAAQIAAATGLSRSTTHRLVTEMTAVGMLHRHEDHTLSVSIRSWETSVRCNPVEELREIARPVLEDLHARIDHHICLTVPDFDTLSVLYLERYDARYPLRIISRHASRLPLHDNSTGLAMLAHADEATVHRVVDEQLAGRGTGTLLAHLGDIRRRGYGHIVGGMVAENTSFAVPCLDRTGSVLCSVGVVARTERCDHHRVLGALTGAGRELAAALDGRRPPRLPGTSPWPPLVSR
ncbi:IclR family transcriptional regulator [Corynebacterium kalidii]|uniref:IclR family transcriptional regulator n=1 Tax=Corynebacterium kalidii TaxID=2931982 RepID=A0A9X2B234_9CORY|nr:IclR family transcriptional regulator [Corynebacterium kalidii]MCJ7858315.1 IclR family transcriptional regulator [Corynebacterium kalidii]